MDKTVRDEWVRLIFLGAIFDWNYFTNAGLTHERIQELAGESTSKMIRHLDRNAPMDGSWSDLQCDVGLRIKKLLGK